MNIRTLAVQVILTGDKAINGLRQIDRESKKAQRDLDGAGKSARQTEGAFARAGKSALGFGKNLANMGLRQVGLDLSNLATTGVAAVAGAMADAAKKAIEFETSMAEISKVVDGLKTPTGETTAEFDKMKDAIFDLSSEMAIAPKGFADIVAAAGQAGIANEAFKVSAEAGRAELVHFSEDAAKMAVAFDMSAEQAGDALAKMRTGLGLSQERVFSLAGTMNLLSNNMAASAPEIVDVTKRIGAMGGAAGLSGEQVSAIGASMIAAGAKSNTAATGLKNFTLAMVAGEAATKRQREAFDRLGVDALDVAKKFSKGGKEAEGAIIDVLSRMRDLGDEERASTMMQLFGKESIGAIAPMLTQLDNLKGAFDLAADSVAGLDSIENEYAVRSKTTANAIQLLKNNVEIAAIKLGDKLIPAINSVLDLLKGPEFGKVGEYLLGGFEMAQQKLAPIIDAIRSTLGGFIDGVMTSVGKVWGALQPFFSAVGDLASKVVEALGLAGDEGSAFGEKTAEAFGGTMVAIVETFTSVIQGLVSVIGFLMPVLRPVADFLKGALVASIDRVTGMITYLRDQFNVLGDAFRAFTSGDFAEGFAKLGRLILNALIEPLRITARMLVDLADALPGGSNLVPGALRTFAGRTAVAGVAGMIEKVQKKAGEQGAAADAAAAEAPMQASRSSLQAKTRAEVDAEKMKIGADLVDEAMAGAGGGSGRGRGGRRRKDDGVQVVTDEDILDAMRSPFDDPELVADRIRDGRKASKAAKKERKEANLLDRAAMDAAGRGGAMALGGSDRSTGGVGPSVSNFYQTFNFDIDARGNEGAAANVERAGRQAGDRVGRMLRGVDTAATLARAGGGTAAGAG